MHHHYHYYWPVTIAYTVVMYRPACIAQYFNVAFHVQVYMCVYSVVFNVYSMSNVVLCVCLHVYIFGVVTRVTYH